MLNTVIYTVYGITVCVSTRTVQYSSPERDSPHEEGLSHKYCNAAHERQLASAHWHEARALSRRAWRGFCSASLHDPAVCFTASPYQPVRQFAIVCCCLQLLSAQIHHGYSHAWKVNDGYSVRLGVDFYHVIVQVASRIALVSFSDCFYLFAGVCH